MVINRNPEYFLTLAQERNFSRAAEKLYISQSSLSQYVSKLEHALSVKLVDRSKSPFELTEAGQVYQSYLESNHYLYQKLQSDLGKLNTDRRQVVNIGLGTWRGSILVPEIMPKFLERYPKASINLFEFPVSALPAMVQNGTVDFAVMNTAMTGLPDTLLQEVIVHERILLVMNRETPEAQKMIQLLEDGRPADLNLLKKQRFISLNKNLTVGRHVNNFLERNQITFADQIHTTNNSTALRLAAKGLGFCFLVETGIEDARSKPQLVAIDLQSQDLVIPLSFVQKKNSYLSPLVQKAMGLVEDYYTELVEENQSTLLCPQM